MKIFKLKHLALPLVFAAVAAASGGFLDPSYASLGRWIVLAFLLAYVAYTRGALGTLSPKVILAVGAYVVWCVFTAAWSEVPSISVMKLCGQVLVTSASLLGGYHWISNHEPEEGLDFLWLFAALALYAALRGSSDRVSEELTAYVGLSGGANFLGAIIALSTPILFWRLYLSRGSPKMRALWAALLAVYLIYLYMTISRASFFIVAAIFAGFLIALGARRTLIAAVSAGVLITLFSLAAPELSDSIFQRNFYKERGSSGEKNAFESRDNNWLESYEGALAGGWIGVGYGVSAGADLTGLGELTTGSYGREKGNSQLAVVEETGIVGLILYAILLIVMFQKLIDGFSAAGPGGLRVLLGLAIGALSGLLLQSVFESWWSGPGSVEFLTFWIMAGAGLGMAKLARTARARRAEIKPVPQ